VHLGFIVETVELEGLIVPAIIRSEDKTVILGVIEGIPHPASAATRFVVVTVDYLLHRILLNTGVETADHREGFKGSGC